MREELQYIRAKLDRIDERQDGMSQTLAINTASLVEHVKRTNLLEEEIKPIKAHVTLVNAVAKILSALFSLALGAKALGFF